MLPALFLPALLLANAPAPGVFQLPIPGHGTLHLKLPAAWKETSRATPPGQPPSITFDRTGTPRGSLEITVFWSPKTDPTFAQEANIHTLTLKGQVQVRDKALEKELPLLALQGAQGKGFYYVATDREYRATVPPTAGDYPVLIHGEIGVGECVVSFTMFADEKGAKGWEEVVEELKGVRIAKR